MTITLKQTIEEPNGPLPGDLRRLPKPEMPTNAEG
jgi:hypothetical protein